MRDGYGCFGKPQKQEKPIDESFVEAIARGKRERQAVLQQVRQRRALVLKRMEGKGCDEKPEE